MEPTASLLTVTLSLVLSFAIAHALFGFAWYSEGAFGPAWRKLSGRSGVAHDSKKKIILVHAGSSVLAAIYGAGLVFAGFFIAAFVMPQSLGTTGSLYAAVLALWITLSLVPAIGDNLYRKDSWKLFAIDKGFSLVFALACAALAVVVPTFFQ